MPKSGKASWNFAITSASAQRVGNGMKTKTIPADKNPKHADYAALVEAGYIDR